MGSLQRNGTLVIHGLIRGECESVASCYGERNCVGTGGPTDVASQVIGRETGDRGVVVGVFPQVLVYAELLVVDGQLLENVVARDFGHGQRQRGDEG